MSSLRHHKSIQKGSEVELSDPRTQDSSDSHRFKFLLDGTTADLGGMIHSDEYDVVTYEDTNASIAIILQAATHNGRTVLTMNRAYCNNELVKNSAGVLVLPIDLKYESREAKADMVNNLLKVIGEEINKVKRYPISVWMAQKEGNHSWRLKLVDPDDD